MIIRAMPASDFLSAQLMKLYELVIKYETTQSYVSFDINNLHRNTKHIPFDYQWNIHMHILFQNVIHTYV